MEIGLFNDRVYAQPSYYYNKSSNLLTRQSLATTTGFGFFTVNSDAVIRNNGWEFVVNTTNIKSTNLTWTTGFNASLPHSKLLALSTLGNVTGNFILGKPVTGRTLYNYAGVDPQTGNYNFTNAAGVKGEHLFDLKPADRTEFVDLAPKIYGGMQNTITYKNFSLNFNIVYTNRKGLNFLGQQTLLPGLINSNTVTATLNRWQKPGDVTNIPKLTTSILNVLFGQGNFTNSTGGYNDASYARLENASLSYHVNSSYLQRLHIKSLTVYAQGQNLFTLSKYKDLDPENLSARAIPPLRVLTAGINLTF